jgi:hypothetical protein
MKTHRFKLIMSTLAFLMITTALIEYQTQFIRRFVSDKLYDNVFHGLPCEKLFTAEEVKSVLEKHKDTIRQIEQVDPGHIEIELDELSCPGKMDIIIWYPSHKDRIKIEQIINNETFFGIPYNLGNN